MNKYPMRKNFEIPVSELKLSKTNCLAVDTYKPPSHLVLYLHQKLVVF